MNKKEKRKIVGVSGGLDPVHVGHVRMIQEAARHGDVIIIANSDAWLIRKKGYLFMDYNQRQEILYAFKGVVDVVEAKDDDDSVCTTLRHINPAIFANGGDRNDETTPETTFCNQNNIEALWGIGGNNKSNSSSWILKKWKD